MEGRKFTFGSVEVPSEYPQGQDPAAIELTREDLMEEAWAGDI